MNPFSSTIDSEGAETQGPFGRILKLAATIWSYFFLRQTKGHSFYLAATIWSYFFLRQTKGHSFYLARLKF